MKKITLSLFALFVLSALFVSCPADSSSGPDQKTVKVKYVVTGTMSSVSSLDYTNSTGGDTKLNNVTLPWEETFTVSLEPKSVFQAKVYALSNISGSLTAKIFINEKEVQSKTSNSTTGNFSVIVVEMIMNL